MPIHCLAPISVLSQAEFAALSYDVMADLFDIRNKLGRFFHERIYKQALANHRSDVQLEVPVDVVCRDFCRRYFLDVLVAQGGLFEFKAVDAFVDRHRAQLLHYLFLLELRHGLLVNVRPEHVQKEFVNATMTQQERRGFEVTKPAWDDSLPGASLLSEIMLALLADWGTGLELALYEEALTHFLGGEGVVSQRVPVSLDGKCAGEQLVRLASDGVAFKLTAFEAEADGSHFAVHARRLIEHTGLRALLWINIARHRITLATLR